MQTHLQFNRGSTSISFRELVNREGFGRLWRGAPVVLMACMPSHAAYFSAYEVAKVKLGVNQPGHHPMAAAAAGAIATSLHDAVLTPLDVVKQRLQLGYYRGVTHCISSILKAEGVKGFMRSYPTTLLMNMPYAAVVVSTNESLKKVLTVGGQAPSLPTFFVSAGLAGALAAAVTCPLDVLKTRLQTASLQPHHHSSQPGSGSSSSGTAAPGGTSTTSGAPAAPQTTSTKGGSLANASTASHHFSASPAAEARRNVARGFFPNLRAQVALLYTTPHAAVKHLGAIDAARLILREEGAGAFFKGVKARMAFHTPSSAISWSTYEVVKGLLTSHALLE